MKLWCFEETDMSNLHMTNTDLQMTDLQSDLQPILYVQIYIQIYTQIYQQICRTIYMQDLQDLQEIYKQICRRYNIGESRQPINSSFRGSSSTSDLSIHKRTQWLILLELIRDQFLTGQMTTACWNGSENGRRRWRFSSEVLSLPQMMQ